MRQIAYPVAVGSCCALGARGAPLRAAEWSVTQNYSSSVDYSSNRRLDVQGKGSAAAVLAIDLLFKRALEDIQFTLEPRYSLRRFTDSTLGNGDDRSINAGLNWTREQSMLNLTASYWDQSTLTTELLETGILSADTHRRMAQAGATWNWNQTEQRSLIAQLSYMDVRYSGQSAALLPGYRYPSATLGERFAFSERGSFTVSTYGSILSSDTPGNSSHELGLQAEVIYTLSERTHLDVSLGESSRVLSGQRSTGTDASVSVDHSLYLGRLIFGYSRSLVPYGSGFLVERQQFTATLIHPVTEYLESSLALLRVQNNETAVLLRLDRRNYDSVVVGLNWHPTATWTLSASVEGLQSQLADAAGESVKSWHTAVTATWVPLPTSRSW
jgi:hypothetical protein